MTGVQTCALPISLPLRDRFAEIELSPDAESWTSWASANVNPHIVAFINWKESYLYKVSESGQDKSTTPRGLKRASDLIGKKDITSPDVTLLASISCGEAFATEFQAYVKYFQALDWDKIYSNPETVAKLEVSQLFAVSGGLSEHFQKSPDKFNDIVTVIEHMAPEFSVMSLRMMRDWNPKLFKNRAVKNKKFVDELAPKLGKFII